MSSTVSGSLSAGAQLLTHNDKLLLPGPSQSDIGSSAPDQGVTRAARVAQLQTSSVISGSVTSPDGDTVELSAEAMQMLQQMGPMETAGADPSHAMHSFSAAAAYQGFDLFG